MMRRAVFLDRDGVINRAIVRDGKPFAPSSLDDVEILPGVKEGMCLINQLGYLQVVVTNQPDVANKLISRETVMAINEHLKALLPVDDIRTCFHRNEDKCNCRKPNPGLILSAAKDLDIDLTKSYLVGDRWRDIEAGERAGCKNFFIDYQYDEKRPKRFFRSVNSLLDAAKIIQELS